MREWEQFVRDHLPPLTVCPERECEIVSGLALQLEQAYADALAGGATEPEAHRRALTQTGTNWLPISVEPSDRSHALNPQAARHMAERRVARRPLFPTVPATEPGLRRHLRADAGFRHRRQHRHLHRSIIPSAVLVW